MAEPMPQPIEPADQPLWDAAGQRLHRRREPRQSVGSVLPIRLRLLPDQPASQWLTADILDISHGGLALLVPAITAPQLGSPVLLDVSDHPGFGVVRLPGLLRWCEPADQLGALQVLGVQLDQPLPRLPPLVQSRK
jgi:hypothetical protein